MHYSHDWSDVCADKLHLRKGPYVGIRTSKMTAILPISEARHIAEIG